VNLATFKAYAFYGLLQLVQHLFIGFEKSEKKRRVTALATMQWLESK